MSTVTVRPTSDGALVECSIYPTSPTTHYDKVDEDPPNDATDYVYGDDVGGVAKRDSYIKGSTGIPDGSTINSITIYRRHFCGAGTDGAKGSTEGLLRNNAGTLAYTTVLNPTVWTTSSYVWSTSPFTAAAWTLDEVNGLQIGCRSNAKYDTTDEAYYSGAISTVWLVIDYTVGGVAAAIVIKGDGLTWIRQ